MGNATKVPNSKPLSELWDFFKFKSKSDSIQVANFIDRQQKYRISNLYSKIVNLMVN